MTDKTAYEAGDEEEAALWVARHLSNAVDATAFSAWLAGGEGRRETFDALWATCMDDAVADGLRLHQQQERTVRNSHRARTHRRIAAGAAAAAATAALVFTWPQVRFALTPEQTFATRIGEISRVTLSDGSTVLLNGDSRIRAKIGAGRREVQLDEGEALFDVTHDPQRPFTVVADNSQVTVLGTRFDLARNGGRVDLEVERGLVSFESTSEQQSAVLVPAQHRAALVNGRITPPATLKRSSATDWQSGWLQVADMPLADIIPRLERWTGKDIVVEDPALLRTRAAGRFRLTQPEVVLESLGELYGFTVDVSGNAYILEKR
ncbi:FecR family protein [Novosphingobium beihaiensis]|uniref:FecR domain-containing protein n=1 Tax=Novosphingobium beihaiensis TaxID=2930389 RepID=A0ABT0BL42_9SPHN|nr:FecR domain-containing protein [Novosphingobium beihaiensis]MCJ2185781.1 FecR domain-containing protein [Novosphingobium beihaiensis]